MKTVILRSREVGIFGIYAYILLTLVSVWTPQVVCNVSVLALSGVSACLVIKIVDAKHYGDW